MCVDVGLAQQFPSPFLPFLSRFAFLCFSLFCVWCVGLRGGVGGREVVLQRVLVWPLNSSLVWCCFFLVLNALCLPELFI